MHVDDLLAAAKRCGFLQLDAIAALARPAAILRPGDTAEAMRSGSRIGGLPSLPAGVAWPQHDGKSLSLIAEIDLASQPEVLAADGLPPDGTLLFFYEAEQSTWGFDPKDAGSFAVIYVPRGAPVVLADWPDDLPDYARFTPVPVSAVPTTLLPPWESGAIGDLRLGGEQLEAYQNLLERLMDDQEWATRCLLGGYPDQIQGEMTLECAMVAAGLYCGDDKAYQDPRMPELRRRAREWRLLLQVASLDEAGMMWGDAGCLYYWIHEDDLRARRFERAWMILQCS